MSTLPSTPWTNIDSVRVAVDAPVSTDLMQNIVVDLNFLYAGITNAGGKGIACFQTAGTFAWTPPAGVSACWVEMVGGGGSYQGGTVTGGNYQVYMIQNLTGAAIPIQIGTGGTTGNGQDTFFGSDATFYASGGVTGGSAPSPVTGPNTWGIGGGGAGILAGYGLPGKAGSAPGFPGAMIIHY